MIAAFLTALLMVSMGWAATLRVPSHYRTIQSALDSLTDGDTVLVALGTYAEALSGPPHAFVLKGDVVSDTGDYPRPVIDPTRIRGSDTLQCLALRGIGHSVIEDLRFRNGAAMYPRWRVGGVSVGSVDAIFRRCVFDSTCGSIEGGRAAVHVEQCRFIEVQGGIYAPDAAAYVTDCEFTGRGDAHILSNGGTRVLRCRFGGNPWGPLCYFIGFNRSDLLVQDCIFGPTRGLGEASGYPTLELHSIRGSIRNNLFDRLLLGSAFITIGCERIDTGTVHVCQNRFTNSRVVRLASNPAVNVLNRAPEPSPCAQIDSNVFEGNVSRYSSERGLVFLYRGANATGNRFHNLPCEKVTPGFASPPVVFLYLPSTPSLLRDNRFDSTGLAVQPERPDPVRYVLRAERNWWGDRSGPYYEAQNPSGRGDTVVGRAWIRPWCADTTCEDPAPTTSPAPVLPTHYSLTVHPNPFNAITVIRLDVPRAEIVRVELFDLLGRRVKELWSGAAAEEKEITVDGSGLAAGIYFVRATETIWNRPLASTKLVLLK